MSYVSINTLATTTPAQVNAQVTMSVGTDCLVIDTGHSDITEGLFYLYVRIGSGTVKKIQTYRYSRHILPVAAGSTVAIGSDIVRAITVRESLAPTLTTPENWETASSFTDESEPRVWTQVSRHIATSTVKKIIVLPEVSGWKDIWISDYDGANWSPARWIRTHPTYTPNGVTVPVFGVGCALCTQDGANVSVKLSADSMVQGASNAYVLPMPTITSQVVVTANDGADFYSKLQAATAGTEVILPAGTYSVVSQITDGDWAQGVTISGQTGDRADVIIQLANVDNGIALNDNAVALRGIRHVTFPIDSTHGGLFEQGTWLHMHNVNFLGDKTRSGVDNVVVGTDTSIVRAHRCNSQGSAADCWNIVTGAGTTVELIDCTGSDAGNAIDAQVITSHLSAPLTVLGGSYSDAHTNLYARATSARCDLEFATVGKGARKSSLLGGFGFGCRTSGWNGQMLHDGITTGYQLFWIFDGELTSGGSLNMLRDFPGPCQSNVFVNLRSKRVVYYNATSGTPSTAFNAFVDCLGDADEALVVHTSGSAGTHTHLVANNTIIGGGRFYAMGDGVSGTVNLRNNASLNRTNATLNSFAPSDWTKAVSGYNTLELGTPNWQMGTGDEVATAALASTLLPTASGNSDNSGNPNLYDWIGGRGPTCQLLIYDLGISSRGALTRPQSGEIFPDVWNAEAVAASQEQDPDPETPTVADAYYVQGAKVTPKRVAWVWVKNSVAVQTASPTIDIQGFDGVSLIGGPQSASVNADPIQHVYEHGSNVMTRNNIYWITFAATIDAEVRTVKIPYQL